MNSKAPFGIDFQQDPIKIIVNLGGGFEIIFVCMAT